MRCSPLVNLCAITCFVAASTHAAPAYKDVRIDGVPHVHQKPDFCGEACAEMWLTKQGRKWTQDQVFDASSLDPALGRGCHTAELNTALKKIGFATGEVWTRIPATQHEAHLVAAFHRLHADLLRGVPSIVCTYYDDKPQTTEHFRLILGYDARADEVLYHEPAEPRGADQRMKREKFLKIWPLRSGEGASTVIRMALEPARTGLKDPPKVAPAISRADFCQHIMKLKEKLPGPGFTVLVQPPFVVIGDEAPATVRRRSTDTVAWAVESLRAAYFEKDPDEILDVWLFKDRDSYMKNARKLWNSMPHTPYGYYSPSHKALVMNIATGGGTLVHEIVHPFMRANFPACPAWFNEGMGSLYEQSYAANNQIRGATNWRLAGLQKAIEAGAVPSFKELTGTTDGEFYNEDRGTNYAQARYLCYYLQDKGLLVRYYKEFVANHEDDPSGYKTLQKVLGERDMDDFKKRWEAFVMGLKFP